MQIVHPIPPLYSADTKALILGSFPSVKSREQAFFYGHPQNRFWRVIAALFDAAPPGNIAEKTRLILENRLGLWDVIGSCEITGSADSSIRNVRPNDIGVILRSCDVRTVFVNGRTAEKYYIRFLQPQTGVRAVCLPSTSPANAAWSLERLIAEWMVVRDCVQS